MHATTPILSKKSKAILNIVIKVEQTNELYTWGESIKAQVPYCEPHRCGPGVDVGPYTFNLNPV